MDLRVFGSRARGDASPESDLDILAVVEHTTHDIEKYVSDCAWEAGFDDDVVVMPVVIGKDQLNSTLGESAFIINVYREGLVL